MTDTQPPSPALNILIVDDEPLARHWLRMQLGKCHLPVTIAEAASAALATQWLQQNECHVILLDIHMPGTNGLEFAKQCQSLHPGTAVIFVTADSSHALQAFDLAAFDYLTKPVSVERLEQALQRVYERVRLQQQAVTEPSPVEEPVLVIAGYQHISRIPLSSVLYFQADSKYVKVVTQNDNYLIENSLQTLEDQFAELVIRVHRAYLVPKHAIEGLVRLAADETSPEGWGIKVRGLNACIPVSRRQLSQVKTLLHQT